MRIKIENKMPLAYERTVGGLKKLVMRLEEEGVPEDAIVYWREYNVAEFLWRVGDGISGTISEG